MCPSYSLLKCCSSELNLSFVLACGQNFRWSRRASGEWLGVIDRTAWILSQNEHGIRYSTLNQPQDCTEGVKGLVRRRRNGKSPISLESQDSNEKVRVLHNYFQLSINVAALYDVWSANDDNFTTVRHSFGGIRMLRQDPVENLFSFICSQNNNIKRITSLVQKLCTEYGEFLVEHEGESFYSFPTVERLAETGTESRLRELGFGYRAKFIHQSAIYIVEKGGAQWLKSLRDVPYKEARNALCCLPGVGLKVADCVCLMSLDKTDAVPIDTHMWQIACRSYLPHLKKYKSLTDKVYEEIGDYFRSLYGEYSGWAHSVLFSADLKKFQKDDVKSTEEAPIKDKNFENRKRKITNKGSRKEVAQKLKRKGK